MSVTTAAAVPFPDDPGGLRIRFAPARRCRWQPPVVAEPVEPMWSPTPIVGYRVWTLKADGVYGSVGHRWAAPTLTAQCMERGSGDPAGAPHLASQGACRAGCGVNAFSTPASLVRSARSFAAPRVFAGPAWPVFGAVGLSGRVVEHGDGYRGQHARVIALVLPSPFEVRSTTDPGAIGELFGGGPPGRLDWEVRIPIDRLDLIPRTVIDQLERTTRHATRT